MIERVQVVPGPGLVVRFGGLAIWIGPGASANLTTFLVESARNLVSSPVGGSVLSSHLAGILRTGDPEPSADFAVAGPSEDGWVALLHGRVQLWDGKRWRWPDPGVGWLREEVKPAPALSVTRRGGGVPDLSPDDVWGLEAGVVPGAGFVLVPASPGPVRSAERERPASEEPPAPAPGVVDLRSPGAHARVVPYPPLPPVSVPPAPAPGAAATTVSGVLCPQGHLNRPGSAVCRRCGRGIAAAALVTATRPPLGCVVTDAGRIFRLDAGYVVGAAPTGEPAVRSGALRPLVLAGEDVAPVHAEIRLEGWDVVVIARAAEGTTHLCPPGRDRWQTLSAHRAVPLDAGSHLAFGQRVLTFLSAWVPPPGAT